MIDCPFLARNDPSIVMNVRLSGAQERTLRTRAHQTLISVFGAYRPLNVDLGLGEPVWIACHPLLGKR